MENSLLSIFDEIWPKTMYYSTGSIFVNICLIIINQNMLINYS